MSKIRKVLVGVLASSCLALTLASCQSDEKISALSLKGYPTTFTVGDEFSSKGLLVEATTKDGNVNVSDDVSIDSSQVNMNEPGVYVVLVEYQNITEPYYVTVNPVANEQRLIALAVDTTNTKTNYSIGETFDSKGLALIATYQNSNDEPDEIKYLTDLSDFDIVIRDKNNNNVSGPFTTAGEYDVYVTQATVRTSFVVSVINESASVADAVATAVANQGLVAGGTSYNISSGNTTYPYSNVSVLYEYGNDLVSLSYYGENTYYEYYSLKNSVASGYQVNETTNTSKVFTDVATEATTGILYSLAAGTKSYYGAEAMLNSLYTLAQTNPNNDYSETIKRVSTDTGGVRYEYSFSFGLLESPAANTYYLHKFEVTFSLSSQNVLTNLIVTSNTYVCNSSRTDFTIVPKGEPNSQAFYDSNRVLPGTNYPKDFPVLPADYNLNNCMARLKATTTKASYSDSYQITQYTGNRQATSKYPNLG